MVGGGGAHQTRHTLGQGGTSHGEGGGTSGRMGGTSDRAGWHTHGAHITQNEWEEQGGPLFFEVHMFMVC